MGILFGVVSFGCFVGWRKNYMTSAFSCLVSFLVQTYLRQLVAAGRRGGGGLLFQPKRGPSSCVGRQSQGAGNPLPFPEGLPTFRFTPSINYALRESKQNKGVWSGGEGGAKREAYFRPVHIFKEKIKEF